jgi:hypothetical protein
LGAEQLRRRGEDRRCLILGMARVRRRGVAVGPRRRHQGLASIRQHDQQLVAAEPPHRPDHLQPLTLQRMPRPGHHHLIHRASDHRRGNVLEAGSECRLLSPVWIIQS